MKTLGLYGAVSGILKENHILKIQLGTLVSLMLEKEVFTQDELDEKFEKTFAEYDQVEEAKRIIEDMLNDPEERLSN